MTLTEEILTILGYSREEAMRTGCYAIAPEHLLLGILRSGQGGAAGVLRLFGLDAAKVKADVEEHVFRKEAVPYSKEDEITFTRSALNVGSMALMEAMRSGEDVAGIHLLCALCDNPGDWCSSYLNGAGITIGLLRTMRKKKSADPEKKSALPSTEDINRLFSVFYSDKEIFS